MPLPSGTASGTYASIDGVYLPAAFKMPCRAATTANISLSGLLTIDGVALADGDRVLVKSQTDGTENGIYVASAGDWARSADFDSLAEVVSGCAVYVVSGSTAGARYFMVTTPDSIVIGGTAIAFEGVAIGPKGDQGRPGDTGIGAIGPAPWLTPVSFSAGIDAVAAAPATSVIYVGEHYVCITPHVTTSTFDTSKWRKIYAAVPFSGDAGSGGVQGIVPAPSAGDAAANKVLGAGGSWVTQSLTVATNSLVGRATAGTGAHEALTPTQVKTMLSLGNVDNTTDANKPVSTATATALAGKADTANPNTFTALQTFSSGTITRARALSTSTDLNTITDDGHYDVQTPVNGPSSGGADFFHVTVKRYSSNTDWIVQTAEVFGFNGARIATWGRKRRSGTWGAWYPTSGWVTPEHYNAAGNGTTDDSSALEYAFRSGLPVLLSGKYRITRKITASRASHGIALFCVMGLGRDTEIGLDGTSAGIEIDIGDVVLGDTAQANFRDFSLCPNAAIASVPALRIQASDTVGSGITEPTCNLNNIHVRPTSTSNYSVYGFSLRNMRLSEIVGCSAYGKSSALVSGSRGFDFSGANAVIPVETNFTSNRAYFYENGFELSGAWEGVKLINNDAIACKVGYKATSTNANLGDSLLMTGNQANTLYVGAWLEDIKNSRIIGNQLTGNSAWGTVTDYYGLYVRANTAAGQFTTIKENNINGEQIKASASACVGLDINGYNTTASLGTDIGPNLYTGFKIGLKIGANTKGLTIDNSDTFNSCDTNVSNGTTGTPNRLRAGTTSY